MSDFSQQFIQFAIQKQVLRFGEFKTKAGRLAPIFSMPVYLTMAKA